MDKIATLYLQFRHSHSFRAAYVVLTVALFGLALCGVYRPNPDCNSGCGLV